MDGARGALLPLATSSRLRAPKTELGAVSPLGESGEGASRSIRMEPPLLRRWPSGLLTDEHPA
jgi:hypothetical protein